MDLTLHPRKLSGTIRAIPSKSQAHRLLICAAFADRPTHLCCPATNRDIEATAACLRALGADIRHTEDGYIVTPIGSLPDHAILPCAESGSTLRFLLPVVGALGVDALFEMEGRLPQRPLSPLWEEMERMGCTLTRPHDHTIRCTGKLQSGRYTIDGGVSSQFITGLLFALSLLPDGGSIEITGRMESRPYIEMTCRAMEAFGVESRGYILQPGSTYRSPGTLTVEGDWSNAAFFLAAHALGNAVTVENLDPRSPQGDRAIADLLPQLKQKITIDASDIPDLVPILAITAAAKQGATFTHIGRLRLKESDRVASVIDMITALGGKAHAEGDTLLVEGSDLHGGIVDAQNDHRIAMAAAIAAAVCTAPVTILGAHCTAKSYPTFWDEYRRLGGYYEQ